MSMPDESKREPPSSASQFGPVVIGPDIDLDVEAVWLADGTRLTEARAEQLADEIMKRVHGRRGGESIAEEPAVVPSARERLGQLVEMEQEPGPPSPEAYERS